MASPYSPLVLDHFHHPRNSGELARPSAAADVTNPVCGDILRLSLRVENGVISEACFKAQGCVAAIACGSAITEMIVGQSPAAARSLTYSTISEALGGLPPATLHAAQLAAEALQAVLTRLPSAHALE